MELIQLLSFHEVVKTESFSKASKKVFRTQSAVSHQIKNLEKELNVKLFERLGKKIRLTEEGNMLFDLAHKHIDNLEKLKTIYADMQNCRVGNLTIASGSGVLTYMLPRITKDFVKQFPGINLKLIGWIFISEAETLLSEGEIDFGIGLKSDRISSKKIDFLPWKSVDIFLLVPKKHPLSHCNSINLVDIAEYPQILYREGALRDIVDKIYVQNKVDHKVVMEVDIAENIKSYVEMGIGVGFLSSATLMHNDKKRFAIINVSNIFGKMQLGIYVSKYKYISKPMKQFIKLLAPDILPLLVDQTQS